MRAIDIANFFIDYNAHCIDDTITNLKLNKLLYFAQGYSLALYNKPLFSENIEAWHYGPVVADVYHKFKSNNKENIAHTYGKFSIDKFDNNTIEILLAVINDYGKYSSSKLIEITHEKGSPWDMVYNEKANNIIPNNSIKEYFKNISTNKLNLDKIETIGKRENNDKPLLLPAEWDDKEDYSIYLNGSKN